MRKWFAAGAALGVLAIAPAIASAQTNVGARVGPVFSKVERGVSAKTGTYVGLAGGFFVQFGHGPVYFQTGLTSTQKGGKYDDPNSLDDAKLKLSYIELPITLAFQSKAGPYVYAGPSVAVESKCESETHNNTGTISDDCNNVGSPIFKRRSFEFSATGAVGYRYRFGKRSIALEAAYTHGFTNINKDSDVDYAKNRSFAITLGYLAQPVKRQK